MRRALQLAARPFGRRDVALASVGLVFAALAYTAATLPISDPDVWWVAAAGRQMLQLGHVIHENTFSATEPHTPWVMHEWAFGLPYALGMSRWGPPFFAAISLAFTTATVALFVWATFGRTRNLATGALVCGVALLFFNTRLMTARPSNVSLIFPVAMCCLAFAPRFTRWHSLGAIAVELLWTNCHGSFPAGLGILGLAAVDLPANRRVRALALAGCAGATVVNPYGLHLHALFWRYLRGDDGVFNIIHHNVYEFRPLWLAPPYATSRGTIGLALFVIPLAVSALWSARWRLRGSTGIALVVAAVLKVRHIELAGLISLILLAPWLDELLASGPVQPEPVEGASNAPAPSRWLALGVLVPGVLAGVMGHAVVLSHRPALDWIGPLVGGGAAATLAAELPEGARVYAPYEASGLVIWYGAARGVSVFYDPRNDCYSAQTAQAGFGLNTGEIHGRAAEAVLDRAGIPFALVPLDHNVARGLANRPRWERAKQVGDWVMLGGPHP